MNFIWNKKWKTVLIWLSAHLNFIAFILVGGYFYIKKEDEEIQTQTKRAFLVTLILAAVNAFLAIFNYIGVMANAYYSSSAYKFYSVCTSLVGIAKIIVFATFIIIALVKKGEPVVTKCDEADGNEQSDDIL